MVSNVNKNGVKICYEFGVTRGIPLLQAFLDNSTSAEGISSSASMHPASTMIQVTISLELRPVFQIKDTLFYLPLEQLHVLTACTRCFHLYSLGFQQTTAAAETDSIFAASGIRHIPGQPCEHDTVKQGKELFVSP